MGSAALAGLTVAGIVLAVAVGMVVLTAGANRRRTVAFTTGAIVLGLAMLNLYQYAVGTALDEKSDHAAQARAKAAWNKRIPRPATQTAPVEPANSLLALSDRELIDRYANLFYDTVDTWQNRQWLGIRALQNPTDAWIHQEIIYEQKPDYIIEAGTAAGGGALLWALILREANPNGRVITIDISDFCEKAREHPLWKERIEFIKASSTDPEVLAKLTERTRGKNVLVILDSDHRKPHVLNELKAYSPMINVGGYLILQDTCINGHPVNADFGPGPMEALEEFLAGNYRFVPDRMRESLLHTMHPKGYLKRVK